MSSNEPVRRDPGGLFGGLFLAAGAVLLGVWAYVVWIRPPLEEPANPGRTPNPSQAPWTYDPGREGEERARDRRWGRLVLYGPPIAGVVLIAVGALSLAGRQR